VEGYGIPSFYLSLPLQELKRVSHAALSKATIVTTITINNNNNI
jgi:hypothetical protein